MISEKAQPEEVLVIGGGGFIGSHLVALLRKKGCQVRILSRHAGAGRKEEPGIRYLRGAIEEGDSLLAAAAGVSTIYHLGMTFGNTWEDFRRHCVDGAANVARACQKQNVRRMIYTSTTAALYLGRKGVIRESDGPDPQARKREFYTRAKVESEKLLLGLHATEGLPVVIFRPAIVVGRGGMLAHFGVGDWKDGTCCLLWGRGRHPLPFVLVEDVARALAAAKDVPGIDGMTFNLAGDVRLSSTEYVRMVAERSLRNYRIYPKSLVKMQAVAVCKWALKMALRKPGVMWPSYRDLKSNMMLTQLDCSLAKQRLGWKPVDDPEVFVREAIDIHLKPVPPGDLRLQRR